MIRTTYDFGILTQLFILFQIFYLFFSAQLTFLSEKLMERKFAEEEIAIFSFYKQMMLSIINHPYFYLPIQLTVCLATVLNFLSGANFIYFS